MADYENANHLLLDDPMISDRAAANIAYVKAHQIGGGSLTWPLTFSGDMEFQPDGVANTVLTLSQDLIALSAANFIELTTANFDIELHAGRTVSLVTDTGDISLQPSGNFTVVPLGSSSVVNINSGLSGGFIHLGSNDTIQLDLVSELQINSQGGAAGQVLTSQGAGLPPIWA